MDTCMLCLTFVSLPGATSLLVSVFFSQYIRTINSGNVVPGLSTYLTSIHLM